MAELCSPSGLAGLTRPQLPRAGGRRACLGVCPRVVDDVWVVSFRTNLVVTVALFVLMVTFFALGAGNYGASTGLVQLGGNLGLVTAALAGYLACAEVCEAPVGA